MRKISYDINNKLFNIISFVAATRMSDGAAESQKTGQNSSGPGTPAGMAKLLEEHFANLSGSVKTLAQAVQTLRSDVNDLKRKRDDDQPPVQTKKLTTGTANPSTNPSTSAADKQSSSIPESSSEDDDDDLDGDDDIDALMEEPENQEEQADEEEDFLADIERFFQGQDKTGPDVGERIAKITNKALRGNMSEDDDENLKKLMKEYRRPGNIPNLQVPQIENFLWRQLKRETKSSDFAMKKALENYALIMTPIIKALELWKTKTDNKQVMEYVKDAFKILGLTIKVTNIARMDKVKKELNPDYKTLCTPEDTSASLLMGDDLSEKVKKVKEGSRNSLTGSSFLFKRGGSKPMNRNKTASHNSKYPFNKNQNPNNNNFKKFTAHNKKKGGQNKK